MPKRYRGSMNVRRILVEDAVHCRENIKDAAQQLRAKGRVSDIPKIRADLMNLYREMKAAVLEIDARAIDMLNTKVAGLMVEFGAEAPPVLPTQREPLQPQTEAFVNAVLAGLVKKQGPLAEDYLRMLKPRGTGRQ